MSRGLLLTGVATLALLGVSVPAIAQDVSRGRTLYERWCVECHGSEGKGDGPAAAWMLPRPRDFRQARYQIRTTANGELPTDADLRRVLKRGMPGTAMPAWPNLSGSERDDVIAYLKSLSPFFEDQPPRPMEFTKDPGGGGEAMEVGRQAYRKLECWKCHGDSGRGNGQSAPTLQDWRDLPIRAADLTEPWAFNGGMGVEEIHTRLLTGLDGTPMPAYSDALESGVVTEDELWQVARYVAALGPDRAPEANALIAVARAEEALPETPEDEQWARVEPSYVPLVGQVIRPPRQFAPTVDGVWVRALHDGEDIVLLLEWNDPSRSPDPEWDEWQAGILSALRPDGGSPVVRPMPDGFAVEFPAEVPRGMERPYFLLGDQGRAVYLWSWQHGAPPIQAEANGIETVRPLRAGGLLAEAQWDDGRWRLLLRRSLDSETVGALQFEEGVPIPVGFFAWDGSSAETMARGSLSGWYYMYLKEPRSPAAYVVPLLVAALTAAGGLAAAARVRHRASGTPVAAAV